MNFGTNVVFHYLFYQLNSNRIYKNEFWHKACFWLLVLSVRNSNCDTSHIPNSQLKIQIIAEHTQPRHVGTAANYKVLHNHISAQLLLSKHRHSKKPTGAKSQELHHKGISYQKTLIGY